MRKDYLQQGQAICPGDTVVDIGANIGCFSVLAAKRVGETGRVVAVEPGEAAYRQLCRNVELNGLGNVTLVHAAIGGRDGKARLHVHNASGLSSLYDLVDEHSTGVRTEEVEVVSPKSLFADVGIEFCHYMKVDCEGAEYDILDTLTTDVASRIGQITLEGHRIPHHEPAELCERLEELGFEVVPGQLLYGRRTRPSCKKHAAQRAS